MSNSESSPGARSAIESQAQSAPSSASFPPGSPQSSRRLWTEIVLPIFATLIAAISLWIAIQTEKTNRQLVEEAAWPFLQIYTSGGSEGQQVLSLNVANAGVGPAKIETFELFWNQKGYASSADVLRDCCGYRGSAGDGPSNRPGGPDHALGTSEVAGTVLRAGDSVPVIRYALTSDDAATWSTFNSERFRFSYRVCYCSVFDECWLTDVQSLSAGQNLNPPRVKVCPRPAIPYTE